MSARGRKKVHVYPKSFKLGHLVSRVGAASCLCWSDSNLLAWSSCHHTTNLFTWRDLQQSPFNKHLIKTDESSLDMLCTRLAILFVRVVRQNEWPLQNQRIKFVCNKLNTRISSNQLLMESKIFFTVSASYMIALLGVTAKYRCLLHNHIPTAGLEKGWNLLTLPCLLKIISSLFFPSVRVGTYGKPKICLQHQNNVS